MDPNSKHRPVNNALYADLGARWYEADDDPVALLRAEAALRNPWVAEVIAKHLRPSGCSVLDVGCGGGFLSNDLAQRGHRVSGLDADSNSLAIAASHDATRTVVYTAGDARSLPYADGAFDVVCAMDFLEHVDEPQRVVAECARVLAPGGLFFFHTFNRNWLSWLIVIKGVEWFVKNTPPDIHVLRLFVKPRELQAMCAAHGLAPIEMLGSRPKFGAPFFRLLWTRVVPRDFAFTFTAGTALGYSGYARKGA